MRLWLGGLASAGVAFSHFLAFLVAKPDHADRSTLLAETGHSYWPYFIALALGALVAGLVGFAAERVWGRPPGDRPGLRRMYGFTATRLVLLQVLGFLYLEAGERLAVHGSFASLFDEPVVLIGLVVQVVVALAAAALLILFARAVDGLRALLRPLARPPKEVVLPRGALSFPRPALRLAVGGRTVRGPPTLR